MSGRYFELPPAWEWVRVGDAGTVQLGRQRSPEHHSGEHMRPYLRVANVFENRIDTSDILEMNFTPVDTARYLLVPGDLLLNEGQSRELVGRPAMFRGEVPGACFQNTLIRFRAYEGLTDPAYALSVFRYYLRAGYFQTVCKWTTNIAHLGAERFAAMPFPLAPIAEQRRIANKLDTLLARVDACRERLDRVPAILKRFRQSVLAAATSGELTREWRKARGVTMSWVESRIGDIAAVGTGSTPLRSNGAFYSVSGTPWITSAATALPFVTRAEEFVTDAAVVAHRLKRYPVGTLLVAMYGEGKTRGQVTELRIEATINQACAAILVDETKTTKAYVRFALESNYLAMRDLAEGGNQPNLNLSKIREFPLWLPSLEEQQVIGERVEEIFGLASVIHARMDAANQITKRLAPAVLAKAFRGELVPQDLNDEPASALLARIHADRGAATKATTPAPVTARGLRRHSGAKGRSRQRGVTGPRKETST